MRRVKEMVQSQDLHLTDALIVVEMGKLDLIKVFSLFNKRVLSVMEMEKKLQIPAITVMVKEKLKPQKKYQ